MLWCVFFDIKFLPLDSTDTKFLIIQPGQGSRYYCKSIFSNKEFAKQIDIMNMLSWTH